MNTSQELCGGFVGHPALEFFMGCHGDAIRAVGNYRLDGEDLKLYLCSMLSEYTSSLPHRWTL